MNKDLRYNIADKRLNYTGSKNVEEMDDDYIIEFNQLHSKVLDHYRLSLIEGSITKISETVNNYSNRGALRNRQLRQSAVGLFAWCRHYRADRRHPCRQSGDQSAIAGLPDATIRGERFQHSPHARTDLQVAHLSTFRVNQPVERGR